MSVNKYCGIINLDCSACYLYVALPCYTIINVPCTNLVNGVSYYFWIIDKFGNIYWDIVVGKANGSFDINTANFPDGIFYKTGGNMDTFISTDNAGLVIVPLTISAKSYNCVIVDVQ